MEGLNENFDAFDNLRHDFESFDQIDEDNFMLFYLARNYVRTEEDLDDFYSRESSDILGFYKNEDTGKFEIQTDEDPLAQADGQSLFDFLQENLSASTGLKLPENVRNFGPETILTEVTNAAGHYAELEDNYTDFDTLEEDLEQYKTQRKLIEIEKLRKVTKVETHKKEERLGLDVELEREDRFERFKEAEPKNNAEGALIWLALNSQNFEYDPKKDLDKTFPATEESIEKNKFAIEKDSSGMSWIVIPYKDSESSPDLKEDEYDIAIRIPYSTEGIDYAIDLLRSESNTFTGEQGKVIANLLEEGKDVYTKYISESGLLEESEAVKENYTLLSTLYDIAKDQPYFWINPVTYDSLRGSSRKPKRFEEIDIPEELQKINEGPWYFGYLNGAFYARTVNLINYGKDLFYRFDIEKGWKKQSKSPELELPIPSLYEKKGEEWEINKELEELLSQGKVNPLAVITQTLNTIEKDSPTELNDAVEAIFAQFGEVITFPPLQDFKVAFDEEGAPTSDSVDGIEAKLYESYAELFVGMHPRVIQKFARHVGKNFLQNLHSTASLEAEAVYTITSGALRTSMIFNPEHFDITVTNEGLSDRQVMRIEELESIKEELFAILNAKSFGFMGQILDLIDLGDAQDMVDKTIRIIGKKWGETEEEQDRTLSIGKFLGLQLVGFQINSMLHGEPPEGNVFTELMEESERLRAILEPSAQQTASAGPQAVTPAKIESFYRRFDVTAPSQLLIVRDIVTDTYRRSATQPLGELIFTPEELDTIVIDRIGKTKKRDFHAEDIHKIAMDIMEGKDDLENTELQYWKRMTNPEEERATVLATQASAEAQAQATAQAAPAAGAEIETPGSHKNPLPLTKIEENKSYDNWHEITPKNKKKPITITSGVLNVPSIGFNTSGKLPKIEIVYKNKKIDTLNNLDQKLIDRFLEENNNQFEIGGKPVNRVTKNGSSFDIENDFSKIKELRLYDGIKLKDPRLNKNT